MDETRDFDTFAEEIRVASLEVLDGRPLPVEELLGYLADQGILERFEDVDDGALAELLDLALLRTDDIWTSSDGIVASVESLLDGAAFTHRVSASELDRGVLDATPDLDALDFDTDNVLTLEGGVVERFFPPPHWDPVDKAEGGSPYDEHGSLVGPPGWLSAASAGDLVTAWRLGGTLELEVAGKVGDGSAEAEALRIAFDRRSTEGVGEEPEALVLEALCHDPTLFREPVPPVDELLERAGLERRGAWVGRRGEDWDAPGARTVERIRAELASSWHFDRCCEQAFDTVLDGWRTRVSRGPAGGIDSRAVARALAHGPVAPAFAELVLGGLACGNGRLRSFAAELAAEPGKLAAPAQFLLALEAEQDARDGDAEGHLRRAVLADPEYGPALAELAWYAGDRGDLDQAISLLVRAGCDQDGDPELDHLRSQIVPVERAGRNDPCPCGSGRKFKACCINGRVAHLDDRTGWLHHKAVRFALRPCRRGTVEDLFEITMDHARPQAAEALLPVLVDLALFEGGGIEEFAERRGELLPADERELVGRWLGSRLTLWEVDGVDPGRSVAFRDTRTGERVEVGERTASQHLEPGQLVLCRVLPSATGHQVQGSPLEIDLRQRSSLLALVDGDPGLEEWAEWLGAAFAPPRLVNHERHDLVLCRGVLRPAATAWDEVTGALDRRFGPREGGAWRETVEVGDSPVVRGTLRREGDDLVLETNSEERYESLLATLRVDVAPDLEVVDEERVPAEEVVGRGGSGGPAGALDDGGDEVPPEFEDAVRELVRRKEAAWVDEEIPALGGITPRQALDDPTRREDLLALLREFERVGPDGRGVTFDVGRLRALLGLSGSEL